jgi:tetratricopeptide (TPR) repeat protein
LYKNHNIFYLILLGTILIFACSPTKDKWLNRNFHTLTGHYNVYFNGEQKLLDAIAQIENGHVNNFDRVLDIFPLGTAETAKVAGNLIDEAIKKFSKTIQMHTIGSFTDDSYFAMGKCRFYKQDYFSSIETFQYVIGKYKNGEYNDLSACWIARNYVGMNKLGEAEALMGLLLAKKDLKKNDISLIYATAADINIKQEKYTTALDNLNLALKGKLKKDQKIRYHYILGQLCLLSNRKPEASYHFNKVISYIPPYEFAFNANISLTRIYDVNDLRSISKVKKNLKKMASDEKNIDYLDQIYFELGKIDLALKNYPEAINNFKKSVAYNTKNKNQKGLSYYELAKLYFEQKEFKNAQAYYDSTVQNIDPKYKQYNQIKETKVVLSDLINNLLVYETEDSLQRLALLSKDEIDRKVTAWNLEEKRKQDLIAKEAKKNAKAKASAANNISIMPTGQTSLPGSGDNSWYFYNNNLVNSGAAEFFSNKKWGQRQNEDYWRFAAKEKPRVEIPNNTKDSLTGNNATNEKNGVEIKPEPNQVALTGDAEKDKWIKNIPFTVAQKERSNQRMLEALHNLGILYYLRLKNAVESKKYFGLMQSKFPQSEYEPEALFYLCKSNGDLNNKLVAEENKQKLISNYPTHPLSLLLQNKTVQSSENTSNKELLAAYEKMYTAYANGNYQDAMNLKSEIDKLYPGNNLKPKVDLLNAFCIGKTQNKEAFKKALEEVSSTHKGLDVAKTADDYLEVINRQDKKITFVGKDSSKTELEFDLETETPFYYIIAIKDTKIDLTDFTSQYANFNEAYSEENNLKVNAIMSNEGFQLITVREFPNYKSASDYIKILQSTDFKNKKLKYTSVTPEYIISTKNFKKVLKENKVEKFAEFYKKQEEQLKPKK